MSPNGVTSRSKSELRVQVFVLTAFFPKKAGEPKRDITPF